MSRGNSGVTLLEVVLSLAIGITAAVFAAELFAGQLAWYGRYGKIREACILADRVSSLLEEDICFGFGFFIDPADPERLCYWTMEDEGRRLHVLEEMDVQAAAEAVQSAEQTEEGLHIQLRFSDPSYSRVRAEAVVLEGEEILCRRERTFISLYEEET